MTTGFVVAGGNIVDRGTTVRPATDEEKTLYAETRRLRQALAEVANCGSGFLQGRCDADCVARTMVQIVHEFNQAEAAPTQG